MDNTIILTFNFFSNPSFNDIFNYCNRFSDNSKKVVQRKYHFINSSSNLFSLNSFIFFNFLITIPNNCSFNPLKSA